MTGVQTCALPICVVLSCLEDSAADRPTILEVISMLKNEIVPLPILKKPAFFTGSDVINEDLLGKGSENYTINGLSISRIMQDRGMAFYNHAFR